MSNWRVGHKVPINIYDGDRPVCQCHSETDARRIVEAVNGTPWTNIPKWPYGPPVEPATGAIAREIIRHTVGEAYVPLKDKRPLTDAELGKIARKLVPQLAAALLGAKEPRSDA